MGKRILCPYCYKEFDNNEIEVECKNNSTNMNGELVCPKARNSKFSDHWSNDSETHKIYRPKLGMFSFLTSYKPKPEKCPQCGSMSDKFVCPHCNNWLPIEMVEKGAEIISVIGGPASGKTNYIVTLIHEMKKYGYKLGLTIVPQQVGRNRSEFTSEKYDLAQKNIFEMKNPVPKTAITKHEIPWIIRLESNVTRKAVYLVFYDTAGENFKDSEKMSLNAKYLAESRAVICVLDTLSVKKVKKIMEANNIENADEATPFDETLTALDNFRQSNQQLLKKPFAFVLSKFDVVLEHHEDLNLDVQTFLTSDGKPRNSEFIKTGKLNTEQIESANQVIQGCLDAWGEGNHSYNINETWGDNAHFFGVSSFGCMPNENWELSGDEDGEIRPYRVMDPLVWCLFKLGGFFKESN